MIGNDPRLPSPVKMEAAYLARLVTRLVEIFRDISNDLKKLRDGFLSEATSVSATSTIADIYTHVFVDSSAGVLTLTIGAASQLKGKTIIIQKTSTDSNVVTIQSSSGNIDGSASISLSTSRGTKVLISSGTEFFTVV